MCVNSSFNQIQLFVSGPTRCDLDRSITDNSARHTTHTCPQKLPAPRAIVKCHYHVLLYSSLIQHYTSSQRTCFCRQHHLAWSIQSIQTGTSVRCTTQPVTHRQATFTYSRYSYILQKKATRMVSKRECRKCLADVLGAHLSSARLRRHGENECAIFASVWGCQGSTTEPKQHVSRNQHIIITLTSTCYQIILHGLLLYCTERWLLQCPQQY